MGEIDCSEMDEPCVTWTGGVTRTGPRQYLRKLSKFGHVMENDFKFWTYKFLLKSSCLTNLKGFQHGGWR